MYLTMNRFRVIEGKEGDFEEMWAKRDSHLKDVEGFVEFHLVKGHLDDGHRLYASHTVWRDQASFEAWTRSDAFRKAHSGVRPNAELYAGPPQLEIFESVLSLR